CGTGFPQRGRPPRADRHKRCQTARLGTPQNQTFHERSAAPDAIARGRTERWKWRLRSVRTPGAVQSLDNSARQIPRRVRRFSPALATRHVIADLCFRRAKVYRDLKDYEMAVADLEAATRLNPLHTGACFDLAWLYLADSSNVYAAEKALPHALRAVELEPHR